MALNTPHGLYFEDFVVGDRAVSPSRTITETDVVLFAGLSGDYNEIHTSEPVAQQGLFGRRVAHGLLGLSIASGLAFQMGFLLGTVEAFRSLEWEFTAPVFIGDTLHLEAEVAETKAFPRLNNGKVTFRVNVKKQDGSVVQRGTWTLLVKSRPKS
ncbi:MAG: MaoC/PaaZ C-terminal domain-containing protein [Anaerolineae bacterium]|nr:MaoC/PaaZ C-terminal domain-containing protein [Thermoflexales bacterium]MDW8396829.1 MaoC/PaaZ C-terminal domain-containing protein [Anaerolineae bacterium]